MKQQNQAGRKLASCMARLTEKALVASANSTSCGIFYQPKAPVSLKKFRKF